MEIEPVIAAPKTPYKTALITGVILAIVLNFFVIICLAPLHVAYIDKFLYSRYLFWLNILFLWLYASRVEHRPLFIWKERAPDFLFFVGSLVLLYIFCLIFGFVAIIPKFFGVHENREMLKKIDLALKGHYLLLVFTALTAGVTEEIIIRGYLFPRLTLLIKNNYVAVVISALVFSIMHFSYFSLQEYIFTFLFGLLTAMYYLKFRDIKVLITFHFLYDLVVMMMAQHFLK